MHFITYSLAKYQFETRFKLVSYLDVNALSVLSTRIYSITEIFIVKLLPQHEINHSQSSRSYDVKRVAQVMQHFTWKWSQTLTLFLMFDLSRSSVLP